MEFGGSLEERRAHFQTGNVEQDQVRARFMYRNQQERRSHDNAVEQHEKQRAAEQEARMAGLFDSINKLKQGGGREAREEELSGASIEDRLAGVRDQIRDEQSSRGYSLKLNPPGAFSAPQQNCVTPLR